MLKGATYRGGTCVFYFYMSVDYLPKGVEFGARGPPHPCYAAADWCNEGAMTAIGILGSDGRMGRAISAVATDLGASIAGGIDAGGDPLSLARTCDVLVDFSAPSALEANLAAACESGTPIVVGTTGLTAQHHD